MNFYTQRAIKTAGSKAKNAKSAATDIQHMEGGNIFKSNCMISGHRRVVCDQTEES